MRAAVERSCCGRRRVVRGNPLQLNAPRPHRKSREERPTEWIARRRDLYTRPPIDRGPPPITHGVGKPHGEPSVNPATVHGTCVMFSPIPDPGAPHIDPPRHFGQNGTPIDEYP